MWNNEADGNGSKWTDRDGYRWLCNCERRAGRESTDVRFILLAEMASLMMHPSIRKRIEDYLRGGEPRLR